MNVEKKNNNQLSVSPNRFKVRKLVNGDIRLSQDGQLVGDMDRLVFEQHYRPKLVGLEVEYLGF